MIKAVVFDMDGVLVDTHRIHSDALQQAVAAVTCTSVVVPEEVLCRSDTSRSKLETVGITGELQKTILREKRLRYQALCRTTLVPNRDVNTMLQMLRRRGYLLGICTNANLANHLDSFIAAGLPTDTFAATVTSSEVRPEECKPQPTMYTLVCQQLSVRPSEVVVFEDSVEGCLAAFNAGCVVKKTSVTTLLEDLLCVL